MVIWHSASRSLHIASHTSEIQHDSPPIYQHKDRSRLGAGTSACTRCSGDRRRVAAAVEVVAAVAVAVGVVAASVGRRWAAVFVAAFVAAVAVAVPLALPLLAELSCEQACVATW